MRPDPAGGLPHPGFVALAVCAPRADSHPHAIGAVVWHAGNPLRVSTWIRRCPADSAAPASLRDVPITCSDYLALVGAWHANSDALFASGYSLVVHRVLLDTAALLVDAYATMGDPGTLPPLVLDVATSLVDAGHHPDTHRYVADRHLDPREDLGPPGHPLRDAYTTMAVYLDLRRRSAALWRKTPWHLRVPGLRGTYRCPHHDPDVARSWVASAPDGTSHRCTVCDRYLTVSGKAAT